MSKIFKLILTLLLTIIFIKSANCNPVMGFVKAARTQIGKTVLYDPSYQILAYPNGDLAIDRGVCTDVILRAMRCF